MEGLRIAIVGAVSLLGKELNEELGQSVLAAGSVKLLDEGEEQGKLEPVGDEVTFVQPVEANSFDRIDLAFFVGVQAEAQKHWKMARAAGASLVDATYALEREPGVLVRAPWVQETQSGGPDLYTAAVVPAHPVAVMLAVAVAGLRKAGRAVRSVGATVLQPASEGGTAGTDELHQQTVNLLSFHSVPQEHFDAQVAFNLLPALGSEARASLAVVTERVQSHYATVAGQDAPTLAVQILQAPVFHGYAVSVLVELEEPATLSAVEKALTGNDVMELVSNEGDPASNVSAAGQGKVLVQVSNAGEKRFWLWMVADNLKLAALNAIACGDELRRLRPSGKVQ